MKKLNLLLIALSVCCANAALAIEITVNGLFDGGAIFMIDGNHRLLRIGDRSPEGVELIAADGKTATFKYGTEEKTLGINRTVSTQFTAPEKSQTRIPTGQAVTILPLDGSMASLWTSW